MPIKWQALHLFFCNETLYRMVYPGIRAAMSQEQRETFDLHNGLARDVLQQLLASKLFRKCTIPKDLGEI